MTGDRPPQPPGPSLPGQMPRRVLLVDDQHEIRRATALYLRFQGFDVIEAANGQTALDELEKSPAFDYALLDVSLPDIDGREVAVQLRKASPETWIALITGWSLDPDEDLPGEIDGVFVKPVSLADLSRILIEGPKRGANRAG
jgi:two-component system OmpR family response regulator